MTTDRREGVLKGHPALCTSRSRPSPWFLPKWYAGRGDCLWLQAAGGWAAKCLWPVSPLWRRALFAVVSWVTLSSTESLLLLCLNDCPTCIKEEIRPSAFLFLLLVFCYPHMILNETKSYNKARQVKEKLAYFHNQIRVPLLLWLSQLPPGSVIWIRTA